MFYHYWTVRYVPDPIRGEFVNIALLVGQDGADWAFRSVGTLRRASRLGGNPEVAAYWLREFERMVGRLNTSRNLGTDPVLAALADSGENISAGIVARLAGRLNNAVQISAPYPIVAEDAQTGLDMLFDHLVEDPQVQSRTRFGTRVHTQFATQFEQELRAGINAVVRPRPHILVGEVPRTASFAVTDSEVEQITNAWSFNLADVDKVSTEIQAWALHMNRLRRRGGVLQAKNRPTLVVPSDVQLRVVFEEPTTANSRSALERAQDIWSDIDGLTAYSEAEQSKLVSDALFAVAS